MFKNLYGSILILASATAFGVMAYCAGLAYADGVDTTTMLALRFSIAALVLTALARVRGHRWPRGKAATGYVLMGAVYSAMAFAYFSALHYTSSSNVAMILYTYPILVAIAAGALRIERFGVAESCAVAASSLGLILMLGASISGNLTGVSLAFVAALCYATYIIYGSRISAGASPIAATSQLLSAAAVIFCALSWHRGIHLPASATGWLAILFLAVVSTALAIAAFIAGLNRVGPTLAAILSTLEPVVTVSLGVAFMGERLQPNAVLGGILIIAASLGLTLVRSIRPQAPAANANRL